MNPKPCPLSGSGFRAAVLSAPRSRPPDLQRLRKELLEFDQIEHITDEMRAVVEDLSKP
jgi:hypothetical protein